jgi:hypothetical protein
MATGNLTIEAALVGAVTRFAVTYKNLIRREIPRPH